MLNNKSKIQRKVWEKWEKKIKYGILGNKYPILDNTDTLKIITAENQYDA